MNLQLSGKNAVVTGGASGIGHAVAAMFADHGADVALIDRDPQVAQSATEIHERCGVTCKDILCDVTNYQAVCQASDEITRSLGPCEHLVCAAGVGSGKYGFPFWNLEPDDWDLVLRVNLMGTVHAAQAFVPGMVKRQAGTLLFIASIAGQIGSQTDPPYSAAKAAVINFAQCAAKDLAPYDVRVNTICPGMIKTSLNRSVWQAWNDQQSEQQKKSYEQWAQEKIENVTPLGRWQQPEDVAALAVFLASTQAKNITGQTLNVDGGQVMHS